MPISMMRPVWLHSIETGKRTVQHTYGDDGLNEQQRQRQQQRQRRPTVTPHEEYPDLASAAERRQRRRLMMAERGRRSFLRAGLLQPRDADASTEAPASQRETTTAARAGATNAAAAANDTAAADSPVAGEVRYSSLRVAQLKELLRGRSLPVGGAKPVLLLRLRQSDGAELEEDETSDSGNSDSETDAGESTQPEEQEEQPEEQEEQPEEQQQQVVEEEDAEEEIAGGSGGFRGESRAQREAVMATAAALASAGGRRVSGRKRQRTTQHEAAFRAWY